MTVGEIRKKLLEYPQDMVACITMDPLPWWIEVCEAEGGFEVRTEEYETPDGTLLTGEFLQIG